MFVVKDLSYKNILQISKAEIPAKKVTCLVGESGAGKSTFLKMLNLMLSPDQGDIFFQGQNVEDIDPVQHRRKAVMLSQHPTIFPGTIRENLNKGLVFSEKKLKGDDELKHSLELVNLHKKLDEEAERLSGGEKQRLALARVLLMDPEVYLLDEPTSALDAETEELVMDRFISEIKEKGKTVIMITHSQRLAAKYGENMIKLEKRAGEKNE
ncbi:ABC transporter ATP-binding protein [Bacillus sp. SA1-12]|uniref:ABC transporter ATP-binding protein n=1 Tax=Bacillus sp. SA1-12 TaxID=1455638 RepID=UPI000624FAE1|nr:ATP-binding cassette domain-containing protein [Bacillus sp. SA1-12]KKI91876.1 ABC transporter ATP-binding protein [Bacillus sp. SA1-12]